MAAPAASAADPRRAGGRLVLLLLLLPGLVALVTTFLMPLLWLTRASFATSAIAALGKGDWTLESYRQILFDPFYWRVAWNTLTLGVAVAVAAVLLAYPIALFLVRTTSRWRGVLTALAVAPLLTSSVVRTYGWMVILGDRGVINTALQALHLTDQPPRPRSSRGAQPKQDLRGLIAIVRRRRLVLALSSIVASLFLPLPRLALYPHSFTSAL